MLYAIKNLLKKREGGQGYQLLIRNLRIAQGARIALTGPSGCGKSTTLDLLGLSLKPDSADVFEFSPDSGKRPVDILALWRKDKQDALAGLRLDHLGYVLQSGELLPYLNAGENMMLTARLGGVQKEEAEASARRLARLLNIERLWKAAPGSLSVGERQRAAIVRALAPHPQIILADEPTAALDPFHAGKVMDAFLEALDAYGSTLVLVTHNARWAKDGGLKEIHFSFEETDGGVTAIVDDGKSGDESC